jgi:hypothetical protein
MAGTSGYPKSDTSWGLRRLAVDWLAEKSVYDDMGHLGPGIGVFRTPIPRLLPSRGEDSRFQLAIGSFTGQNLEAVGISHKPTWYTGTLSGRTAMMAM